MNDYYALAYTDLRLAELHPEARRERFVPTRSSRVHRGGAIDRLRAALRPAPPAPRPAACCA